MSLLERVFYFHQEVLRGNFPNSTFIAEQFEVSSITSKRDINYLRDRLCAPLEYSQKQHGYFYSEEGFQLPFEDSPRIIFLLAMLNKLAGEAGLGELKEVKQLEKKLTSLVSGDYEKIIKTLHFEWIEVEAVDHRTFENIIDAIVKNRLVEIVYRSIGDKRTNRKIVPHQIINYQGRWYLNSYCLLRNCKRLFHMSRIESSKLTTEPIQDELRSQPTQQGLSFGIFSGKPRYTATILFSSTAAELVRGQHWHKNQVMKNVDDDLLLQLPVGDDRELVMKILQYGAKAKVISPPELVKKVSDEVRAMAASYAPLS